MAKNDQARNNGRLLRFRMPWLVRALCRTALLLGLGWSLRAAEEPSAGERFVIGPLVTRVNADSAVLIWVGPPDDKPGRVVVERSTGGDARTVTAETRTPPFEDRHAEKGVIGEVRHMARIDGLAPFTAYRYRVVTADGVSAREGAFTTAPLESSPLPFSFCVIVDTHGGHDSIATAVAAAQPHFVVHAGDFIGGRGHEWGNWLSYFASARPYLEVGTIWPVAGGHDIRPDTNIRAFFGLDDPAGAGPGPTRNNYTFTYGNLRYIVIDEYASDRPAQLVWLEQVLAANTATWTFVSMHSPTFAAGSRGSVNAHEDLVPAFERYGVDVVIAGHNHIYERLLPIGPRGGNPVHYFCINSRGNFRVVRPSPIVNGGIGRQVLVYAVCTVEGNRLSLAVRQPDGTEIDRLDLIKTDGRYQPDVMERAIETELARRIAHVYTADGRPAGMYERSDIALALTGLPRPGETLAARLDTRAFPPGCRLRVTSDPEDNAWRVAEKSVVVDGPGVELLLTAPAHLVFAEGTPTPPVRLGLNIEIEGRLFDPVIVSPTLAAAPD